MPKFDPSSYLTSQGWEGKGKALQKGHATRPIAVVQKKTLAGVGKDRDEATPFWDHIFATTALQIKIPSASASGATTPIATSSTPTPSGTSTPIKSSPSHNTSTDAKTYIPPTAYGRTKQQLARVSLYSRFTKGAVVVHDVNESEDDKIVLNGKNVVASSSRVTLDPSSIISSGSSTPASDGDQILEKIAGKVEKRDKVKDKEEKRREKEERSARRNAKKEKKGKGKEKEEEEENLVIGDVKTDNTEMVESSTEDTSNDKKKKGNSKEDQVSLNWEDEESTSARKKKRRRTGNDSTLTSEMEVDGSLTLSEKEERRERKKKRKDRKISVVPMIESL